MAADSPDAPGVFLRHLQTHPCISLRTRATSPFLIVCDAVINVRDEQLISTCNALCTISIGAGWDWSIPRIVCHEKWIRHETNWHTFLAGNLCIEFPQRWRDELASAQLLLDPASFAQFATEYFMSSAIWLLVRHRFGFENGIKIWPDQWPGWPHGDNAKTEYAKRRHAA